MDWPTYRSRTRSLRRSRRTSAPRGSRTAAVDRGADRPGDGVSRRRSLLGRGHRWHPLRTVSDGRASRAACSRSIDDCEVILPARAGHARDLAALPMGSAERRAELRRVSRGARALRRCHQLEHLSGPARAAAVVQVRQPEPHRSAVRRQAIEHNLECLALAAERRRRGAHGVDRRRRQLPGAGPRRRALDRYLDSLRAIYAALPDGCRLFIEHKLYEPAFYSTVLNDWGTSYLLRPRARATAASRSSISATTRRT